MSESSPPLNGDGSEAALSERQFASAFGHAAIGMALCAPNGRFIKVNEALCQMLGYSEPELLCRTFQELTHPDDLDDQGRVRRLLAGEFPSFHMDKRYLHRDGHAVWALLSVSSVRDASGQHIHQIAQLQDITARKAQETEIARLTRLYAALSHINQAIVRLDTREALFQSVCESLVKQGGFTMAWMGWHDPELQMLVPLATSGDPNGDMQVFTVTTDDRPTGRGPTGTAFQTRQPYVCNDIRNDPGTAPWREIAERRGLHSCAAFPIRLADVVCGTLSVYADAPHVFQDKEIALLSEAARDVSFALDNIARNAERQLAEDRHIASEARLAAAQALAHMGSWELDLATMTGTYSAEMFRLFYRDPVLGAPAFAEFTALVHPEDRHLIDEAMAYTAQAAAPYTLEYRTHPSLGPVRDLSATIQVLRDAAGQPVRTQGTTLDVTERKHADAVLARMKAIVDSSDDAIISKDLNGIIESWNHGAEKIFGYGAGEIIGSPVLRLIPPERQDEEAHILSVIRNGGLVQHFETVRMRKGGSHIDVSVTTSPIRNAAGEIIGASKVARDITERKHVQMSLQTSLQEKEALLKEVHHRVKNNLQVINSLLRLEAGRNAQPETRTVLRDMQGRIQAMALLHESLYRTGIFAQVDLGAYLRQMASHAFRTLALSGGAPVQLELALEPVQVDMDQATPCGLLVNELISNCLKHAFPAGQGGTVRVELQALGGTGQARLCVSDTGVGLPVDFEARKSQSLGLQLVSDLARQLQGHLQIGPGPSFAVTFPQAGNTGKYA